jgi:hypothetical protein
VAASNADHCPRTRLAARCTDPTSASSIRVSPTIAYRCVTATRCSFSRRRNTSRWYITGAMSSAAAAADVTSVAT